MIKAQVNQAATCYLGGPWRGGDKLDHIPLLLSPESLTAACVQGCAEEIPEAAGKGYSPSLQLRPHTPSSTLQLKDMQVLAVAEEVPEKLPEEGMVGRVGDLLSFPKPSAPTFINRHLHSTPVLLATEP